ncbi:MAG: sensor histidine kinase [Cytophagales bacterium]|nr:sensor histidine kinase [Cytophagales bacterium]
MKRFFIQIALVSSLVYSSFGQANDSLRVILSNSEGAEKVKILTELSRSTWHNYPKQAMAYSQEALKISEALGDSANISISLRCIGAIKYYQGNHEESLDYMTRGLDIALKISDSLLISQGYNNVGVLQYNLANYQTALEYFIRSREIKKRIGDVHQAANVNNMGLVFEILGEHDLARSYFLEAYEIAVKSANRSLQIYTQNDLGISHINTSELDIARDYFEEALVLAKKIDNVNYGSVSLRRIGQVVHMQGDYDSAFYFYQQSLEASKSIGDKRGIAEGYSFLSKLLCDQGKVKESLAVLNSSHEIANGLKLGHQLLENLKLYSVIHQKNNAEERSIQYLMEYIKLRDSLFQEVAVRNLSLIPVKIKEERDREKLAQQNTELHSKGITNRLYMYILFGVIPLIIILIVVFKKNYKAYRVLRESNEEVKRTHELLLQSEKMASLGMLAAGLGHEINNPLNFIKNGTLTLFRKIEKDNKGSIESLEPYFDIISDGVNRASSVVKSLSHFSKEKVDMDEKCDIHDIIENCLVLLNFEIKYKSAVVKELTKKSVMVLGDEGKLHQAIMSVLSNAADAIEKDGTITVTTKVNNGNVVVNVKDTGVGISQENMKHINEPFFTTKGHEGGTGLGLFITYSIIEEHNAKMEVLSESNEGTEVTISIPVWRSK